jgi:hypothetical protein
VSKLLLLAFDRNKAKCCGKDGALMNAIGLNVRVHYLILMDIYENLTDVYIDNCTNIC